MDTRILICMGTSGISAGADKVAKLFEKELAERGLLSRYEVVRTGDRGLFRDVLVDIIIPGEERVTYENVKPEHVRLIVEQHLIQGDLVMDLRAGEDYRRFFAGQMRIVLSNCGEIDPENIEEYVARGGYDALEKALDLGPESVLEEVKRSGLRGRGGAGFPTGRKWGFAREAGSRDKYVICNADEGDPGAFMDRSILESDPHAVIEGMIIAGYVIGAGEGYVYCRAEYPLAIRRLNKAIDQARERGFLGNDIFHSGFSFDLSIKEGAGAFVCGEETALIASIEGRRGTPVPRPPFPAQEGLWGRPTLINNVETLANIRHILLKGGDWFSSVGHGASKGTKVFALAGKVKNTGLVEIPMGSSIRDLIYGPGGGMASDRIGFKGVQIGGPSGGCLPEGLLETPIDYESITRTGAIMGSGGMIVMDQLTCMVDIAKFFLDFTVAESCGKCAPCRVGLKRMVEVIEKITKGQARREHLDFLQEMSETIVSGALCGLGNTAPNPVLTTLRYFREEYEAHINDKECPSHACVELVKFEVIEDKCVRCGLCHKVCPKDAVIWAKGEKARIDNDKCVKCKACINACPFMAIR